MKDESQPEATGLPLSPARGYLRFLLFLLFALIMVWLGHSQWVKERFSPSSIESTVERLGVWGPLALAGIGFVLPFLMVPRWPMVFVAGALYGIWCGTALGVFASGLGSAAHFLLTRRMLRRPGSRWRQWLGSAGQMDNRRGFLLLFFLRAFPLTHCGLINVTAAALHMEMRTYLSATLLGMVPSSLVYAAWGKLMQRPHPAYYVLAVVLTLVLAGAAGVAIRKLLPTMRKSALESEKTD